MFGKPNNVKVIGNGHNTILLNIDIILSVQPFYNTLTQSCILYFCFHFVFVP